MFAQKFTNTNEMLQCTGLYGADFVAAKLAQLNTSHGISSSSSFFFAPIGTAEAERLVERDILTALLSQGSTVPVSELRERDSVEEKQKPDAWTDLSEEDGAVLLLVIQPFRCSGWDPGTSPAGHALNALLLETWTQGSSKESFTHVHVHTLVSEQQL
jgi:hypothetical protein